VFFQACESIGAHWNPTGVNHGSHAGDLGNHTPINGRILKTFDSSNLQLSGPLSIIGRSIAVHENIDDGGKGGNPASLKAGNSGKKIACGTIGLMKI
jgi:Cu-Zn family superoxide dismutase